MRRSNFCYLVLPQGVKSPQVETEKRFEKMFRGDPFNGTGFKRELFAPIFSGIMFFTGKISPKIFTGEYTRYSTSPHHIMLRETI